ncbi:hypothetical protein PMAYCL1PPCAC_26968, partial [Pristionchus mayeri]
SSSKPFAMAEDPQVAHVEADTPPSETEAAPAESSSDAPAVVIPLAPPASSEDLEQQQRQLDEIRAEVIQTPLVGEKIPFESVACEYDKDVSPEFYNKALELCQTYDTIRVIRKDGNCFYRAFLVAQVELILADPDEKARFVSVCKGWKDRLLALGFNDFTTTDFCDTFYEFLDGIVDGGKTWARLYEETFLDDNNANYLIIFLRLVASGYVKEHEADYAPFIDGERTLHDYCVTEIEQMWVDADHLAITAFVHAMGSPIRIEYMDRGAAPDGGWHYEFPEASEQPFPPRIHLLYRPGHYDVIYKK